MRLPISGLRAFCIALAVVFFSLHAVPHAAHADTKFTIRGDMDFSFQWIDRPAAFNNNPKTDSFKANQRLRLFLTARTSDALSFYSVVRIRPHYWGDGANGYALDADGVNLRVRQMRMDWREPGSPLHVRLGIIPIILPGAAFHSSILFSSGAGVQAAYDLTQNVALKLGWYRPYDDYADDSASLDHNSALDDTMDMMHVALPLKWKGYSFEPWGLHARIGKDSSFFSAKAPPITGSKTRISVTDKPTVRDNGVAWWGGLSGIISEFDPLSVKFDFAYGSLKTGEKAPNYNAEGWYADLALDYKMKWGTPGVFGWYATGSDYDDVTKRNRWGYAPPISSYDEGFNPTSFGFSDSVGVPTNFAISRHAAGHWGAGVQVADIPSFGDLKHLVRVSYYEGTNDKKLASMPNPYINRAANQDITFLTRGDSVTEVNINHEYPIYPSLTLMVGTGYLNLERGSHWKEKSGSHDAWQCVTRLRFVF